MSGALGISMALTLGLLGLVVSGSVIAAEPEAEHAVEGRFSLESEAGGAVWAFRPGGALIVTGPGELIARGTWTAGHAEPTAFDATVAIEVTDQELSVLGDVSADGMRVAMYVTATDPGDPDSGVPWPPESRLVGERFGMVVEATPRPSPDPAQCQRPAWQTDGTVLWDRCASAPSDGDDVVPAPEASPAS